MSRAAMLTPTKNYAPCVWRCHSEIDRFGEKRLIFGNKKCWPISSTLDTLSLCLRNDGNFACFNIEKNIPGKKYVERVNNPRILFSEMKSNPQNRFPWQGAPCEPALVVQAPRGTDFTTGSKRSGPGTCWSRWCIVLCDLERQTPTGTTYNRTK